MQAYVRDNSSSS